MIKHIVRGIGFALALLSMAGAARAELVQDLYEADVVVADQSAAELARLGRSSRDRRAFRGSTTRTCPVS